MAAAFASAEVREHSAMAGRSSVRVDRVAIDRSGSLPFISRTFSWRCGWCICLKCSIFFTSGGNRCTRHCTGKEE